MQNYTLDPYQLRLMKSEQLSSSIYIHGAENTGKTTALISKIYKDIQEGKNTVIFVKSEQDMLSLIGKISASPLAPYCGTFEPKHRFDVEQIARLRALERNDKTEENASDDLELIYDFQHLREEIKYNFKKMSDPFFGQMNWSQLVQQYLIAKSVCPDHIIDARLIESEFEFSKNEYWLIKGRIEKAADRFTPEFLHREKLFKDDVFLALDHPAKMESILEKLLHFEIDVQKIVTELKIFFRQKIEEMERKLSGELMDILNAYTTLIRSINLYFSKEEQYANEMKLFGFGQKYRAENKLSLNAIHSQLADLRIKIERAEWLHLNASDIPEILSDDILQTPVFEQLDQLKKQPSDSIDKELKQLVRRMNLRNQEDEWMESFETKIDTLIRQLNQSRLFQQKFEMHALNIHAKYIQLNQINTTVQKAIACLQHDKIYFSWMHLWVNLPEKTKKIIHQLHDLSPQKWVKAFDRWYLYHMLKMSRPDESILNEDSLSDFIDMKKEYENTCIKIDLENFKSKVQDEIKTLKNKHGNTFKELFKKQLDRLNQRRLLEKNFSFISAVFPCLIVHMDVLESIYIPGELPVENVVFHQVQPADLQHVKFSAKTQYFHISHSLTSDIPGKANEMTTNLPYPAEWVHMQEESPGKVLKQAQYFAQAICSLRTDFVCYLTKDETMISMLPDIYNNRLMQEYDKLGIKQFWTDQNLVDQLTECFLRKDQGKKLLLLDGLISLQDNRLMDWQFELIEQLKHAGVQMINIWSTDLFQDNSKLLFTKESRREESLV